MQEKIKICLVDDQHLFRKALAGVIAGMDRFELLGEMDDGNAFLEMIGNAARLPDVAIVDLNMPGINGAQLTGLLRDRYPSVRIIILSVYNQERFIAKMVDMGANGYLTKNCGIGELAAAIEAVHKTGFYFNDDTVRALRNGSKYRDKEMRSFSNIPIELTAREREVLLLICQEYSNAEIASKLYISSRTAEGHRSNLLAKIGCKNTAGLVIFAIRNDIYTVMS